MITTKRYTPPTCTLEVTAKQPLLSRIGGESALEDIQFQLSFDDPRLPKEEYVTIRGDRHQLQDLSQVVNRYVQQFLRTSVQPNASFEVAPSTKATDIHLQSDGLLYHDLFLGSLAPQQNQSCVHLSVLQLFDLATALQECVTEIAEVPTPEVVPSSILPLTRIVLTVLVSIEVLIGLIKLVNVYRQEPTPVATQASEPEPLPPPNLSPPPITLAPLPTPTPTPPAPETLSPNLPSVTTAPLPIPSPIFPNSVTPTAPPTFPNVTPDVTPDVTPNVTPDVTPTTNQQLVIIPTEPAPRPSPSASPVTAVQPSPPQRNIAPNPTPTPSIPVAVGRVPSVIQLPPLQNPEPPVVMNVPPPESNSENEPDDPESASYLDQLNKRPQTIAASRAKNTTLFDQIPQVAEVRTYFQQNWYPPKSLQRSLQYNLQLNADGSIQSITPIGQPSVNRLKQIEFPPAGEQFVSANEQGEPVKIRVILQPSGRVQTFLETLNE